MKTFWNRFFGEKKGDGCEKGRRRRTLRLETLEARQLLSVTSGFPTPSPTTATVYVVTTLEDVVDGSDGVVSLREAISSASDGDVITFAKELDGGTISLSGTALSIDKAITIEATRLDAGITVSGNNASGVFRVSAGTRNTPVQIVHLTITGANMSAVYNTGTLLLSSCQVTGNRAKTGAGIYHAAGELGLVNCVITENAASGYGGGIYTNASLLVTNTTIVGNSAKTTSGGVYNKAGDVRFLNSIIVLNTSNLNPDISNSSGRMEGFNVISDFTEWTAKLNARVYSPSKPLFVDGENGDYRLATDSQAIDRGKNTYIAGFETDLAGKPRIVNEIVDLGAYEYQIPPVTHLVVNTLEDLVDPEDNLLSLREAISASTDGTTITFDAGLNGGTITLSGTQLSVGKAITIDATDLEDGITISGDKTNRVFQISGGTTDMPVQFVNLTITDGKTSTGAGVNNDGCLVMTDCVITANSGYYGAGINNAGTLTLQGCEVTGNTTSRDGAGIRNLGNLTITNSLISGNTVTGYDASGYYSGAGFYNSGLLSVTNSAVTDNITRYGDGAGFYNTGMMTLTNVTVAGNTAKVSGGGIYNSGETALLNSVVALNTAKDGVDVFHESGRMEGYQTLSTFTDWDSSNYTYVYDPVLPLFFDVVAGDYTLASGSQAIDQGENDYSTEEFDLAGNPRIVNEIIDLGAYEYQGDPPPSKLIVTMLDDVVDPYDDLVSLREAIASALAGETITFDAGLDGGTITLSGTELSIDKAITIDASALSAGITVNGNDASGGFSITAGTAKEPVQLINLTVTGCNTSAVYNTGSTSLIDCVVMGNQSQFGAGIYHSSGTMALVDCAITGNKGGIGVGIYHLSGTMTLVNCVVAENVATAYGGGIYSNGTMTITNTTITGNSAKTTSGGVIIKAGTITFLNSIIALNTSNTNPDINNHSGTVNGFNVVSGFTEWTSKLNARVYSPSKPLFVDGENGDYRLATDSQAIDRGKNTYIAGFETDLAGNPRIVNEIVDLGAYEYQGKEPDPLTPPTSLTVASAGANRHQVAWDASENAVGYELAYSVDQENWTILSTSDLADVVTGLNYGDQVYYKVKAVGDGEIWSDSDWSDTKSLYVCPMDINGDKIVSSADMALMSKAWFARPTSDNWDARADIDGSNMVNSSDMAFLSANWLKRPTSSDLLYPASKAEAFADVDFDALDVPLDDLFDAEF